MTLVYLYILFVVFCMTQGITHAFIYCQKGASAVKWNEHVIYVMERSVFFLAPVFSMFLPSANNMNIKDMGIFIIVEILSLSFWHNGAYYTMRGMIDEPGIGWFSQSKHSTADIEVNPALRTIGFIIGTLLLVAWIIDNGIH